MVFKSGIFFARYNLRRPVQIASEQVIVPRYSFYFLFEVFSGVVRRRLGVVRRCSGVDRTRCRVVWKVFAGVCGSFASRLEALTGAFRRFRPGKSFRCCLHKSKIGRRICFF